MRRRPGARSAVALLLAIPLLHSPTLLATNAASGAAAQTSREATNDQVTPPNVVTGPDFRLLMKIMRTNIVACGGPLTAVIRLHVQPDGLIDDFVLHKSSGNICFDEIVILNAQEVIKAKLRITPATRNGAAEAAWAPLAVAARD